MKHDPSPSVDDLLRIAREHERPPVGQKERVRAAVLASLAAPPGPDATTDAGTATAGAAGVKAAATTAGGALATKVAVTALVVAAGVGLWAGRSPSPQQVPRPIAPAGAAGPADPGARAAARPAPAEPPHAPDPASGRAAAEDAPGPKRPEHRRRMGARGVPPTPVSSTGSAGPGEAPLEAPLGCDLSVELALLRPAQGALRAGATLAALGHFEAHRERCPAGTLAEEREAGRLMALCQLGRLEEARQALARFRLTSPRSPHLGRVSELCAKVEVR